jgi:hypothetical protein
MVSAPAAFAQWARPLDLYQIDTLKMDTWTIRLSPLAAYACSGAGREVHFGARSFLILKRPSSIWIISASIWPKHETQ